MDELDMRRRCIAAPNDSDPAFRQWLASTPTASATWQQARHFDHEVSQALQQVDVPEGLNGRILLRTGLQSRRRIRPRTWAGLALAASLLLGISLSPWPTATPQTGAFQQLALDHVHHEIDHLQHPPGHVSTALVSGLFEQMGGKLKGSLGDIQFAFNCPTPLGRGLHLIADNAAGRVSVLYLPNAATDTQATDFSDHRFQGRTLLPAAGGALAVIGDDAQAVALMEQALLREVSWNDAQLAQLKTGTSPKQMIKHSPS